jgi:hypothetical protein
MQEGTSICEVLSFTIGRFRYSIASAAFEYSQAGTQTWRRYYAQSTDYSSVTREERNKLRHSAMVAKSIVHEDKVKSAFN